MTFGMTSRHNQPPLCTVRYAAAVVMALAYGKIPKSYFDPVVLAVNRCLTRLGNNLRPGLWRVDDWPILRYDYLPPFD